MNVLEQISCTFKGSKHMKWKIARSSLKYLFNVSLWGWLSQNTNSLLHIDAKKPLNSKMDSPCYYQRHKCECRCNFIDLLGNFVSVNCIAKGYISVYLPHLVYISAHLSVVIRRFILWWVSDEKSALSMLKNVFAFCTIVSVLLRFDLVNTGSKSLCIYLQWRLSYGPRLWTP